MTHADIARTTVERLVAASPRRTGAPGNQEATRYFEGALASLGYQIDSTPFPVLDYHPGQAQIVAGGTRFEITTAPYSLPIEITARPLLIQSVRNLESSDISGAILLFHGEICDEQVMPKNFAFYNPEHHTSLINVLESRKPAAVIAATGRNPEVGAIYPWPLFVDGDFEVPNAFCTDVLGGELSKLLDSAWDVRIEGRRVPSTANNVIARINPDAPQKVTIAAHIDAYEESPGASDNASGIAALHVIAAMLTGYRGDLCVEIVAINGEDHYSAAGEIDYLNRFGNDMERIALVINIDGIGYVDGSSAWSLYECPASLETRIRRVLGTSPGLVEGQTWYSGDHMVFVQQGKSALAFTAERMPYLMETVTHTGRDTPGLLDPHKIVEVAAAVATLVREL